ncbi:NAD-dependent epimerase/dehydratase family protein [Planctomycetota bacterium]
MSKKNHTYINALPDLKGQRVLITGGLGFIGSNLAHKCVQLGAQVTIFDCLDPRSGGNLYNIHSIRDSVKLALHDILTFDHVSEYVMNTEIIFNCAASTSHPFSMREPWLNLDINGRGVINLLEAVRRFNREVRFIHLGTTTQLGPLQYQPADESHPEFPTDIYSANKSASEKFVLIYAKAYKMDATCVRLSNVFGPRAAIHSPDFTFNNYFVGLALQNRNITVYGDGKQLRNAIYVDDVCEALIMISKATGTAGKALFATGDKHYSVAEIAQATVKNMGKGDVTFIAWPESRKSIEVGDAVISNQLIKSIIDWSPQDDLESGLLKTRAYYETCLDKYLR